MSIRMGDFLIVKIDSYQYGDEQTFYNEEITWSCTTKGSDNEPTILTYSAAGSCSLSRALYMLTIAGSFGYRPTYGLLD